MIESSDVNADVEIVAHLNSSVILTDFLKLVQITD